MREKEGNGSTTGNIVALDGQYRGPRRAAKRRRAASESEETELETPHTHTHTSHTQSSRTHTSCTAHTAHECSGSTARRQCLYLRASRLRPSQLSGPRKRAPGPAKCWPAGQVQKRLLRCYHCASFHCTTPLQCSALVGWVDRHSTWAHGQWTNGTAGTLQLAKAGVCWTRVGQCDAIENGHSTRARVVDAGAGVTCSGGLPEIFHFLICVARTSLPVDGAHSRNSSIMPRDSHLLSCIPCRACPLLNPRCIPSLPLTWAAQRDSHAPRDGENDLVGGVH